MFEGKVLSDKREIANKFNKYFIETVKQINEAIPSVDNIDRIQHSPSREFRFEFQRVSVSQVDKYLHDMKKKSSKDCFDISVNLLLDGMPLLGEILNNLINDSFESSYFPTVLRQSIIVPIRKVPGTTKMEEFRPINTLPCIEKLMEKIACDQLNEYIDSADILCNEQSGFRTSHSCESAINYVISDWKDAQEKNETVLAVFLDFQRAFETIDRQLLLQILEMYGVGPDAVNWFGSYLSSK